ncbi:MAG: HDIG domain-containing metalloprotein [bacterium]
MKTQRKFKFIDDEKNTSTAKIIILILSFIISAVFFVTRNTGDAGNALITAIQPGKVWNKTDLRADYTFQVPKHPDELGHEIDEAANSVYPVFRIDENAVNKAKDQAKFLIGTINPETGTSKTLPEYLIAPITMLPKQERATVLNSINRSYDKFFDVIYNNGLSDIALNQITPDVITVDIPPTENYIVKKTLLFDKESFKSKYSQIITNNYRKDLEALFNYIADKIYFPNLIYDDVLTEEARRNAASDVPKTAELIKKNSIIIAQGQTIDDYKNYVLSIYFKTSSNDSISGSRILSAIGNIVHSSVLVILILMYVFIMRKDIWASTSKVSLIFLCMIANLFLAWLTMKIETPWPLEYIIVLPAFILLLALTIDTRIAILFALVSSLQIAGIRNNDYIIGATYIIATGVTAYTVRKVTNRSQVLQTIIIILIGFVIPILFFGIETNSSMDKLLGRIAMASVNSIVSPMLTIGLLIVIERSKIMRSMNLHFNLKDYDKLDHPVLRLLNEKAAGTFQHSLSVANLAEICALEIGANPVLVRVGALYHDIGKMNNPKYFTENQSDGINPHDQISPKRSVHIIKNHVFEGLKLAEEYNLPDYISAFIPSHHGTTLIKHFYAKALEEDSTINEKEFRYNGAKPKSKEQVILMICDTSEAISRISGLSESEIQKMVIENVHQKIIDGQFDQSDITINDLKKIEDVLTLSISGTSHYRTKYKEIPKKV